MPTKGGKRVELKRERYQAKCMKVENIINLALMIHNNLVPIVNELTSCAEKLYKLIPLEFDVNFPDFSNIPENDPRYLTYKLRYIFGSE